MITHMLRGGNSKLVCEMSGSETSRCEMSASQISGCETPGPDYVRARKVRVQHVRLETPMSERSAHVIMEACCGLAIEYKCKTSNTCINKRIQNSNEQIEYK